ncbi:MAG: hypothetical protein QNK23_08405 [Crocinitomicaceae bacterium]|nr:hypothetical protein [Crocinitomicaceae bacterium]
MKILFFLTTTYSFLFFFNSYGQGGWDIGYIQADSVSLSDIGKDVKLDFKRLKNNSFHWNLSTQDTATLLINEEEIELVEIRIIHLDWGFYHEQYLECQNYSINQTLRIYHTVIEDSNDNSIKFRLYIEVYLKNKKGNLYGNPRRWCRSIWIDKKQLNGLMFKE